MKRWTQHGHYNDIAKDVKKLSQREIDRICIDCGAGFNFSGCSESCRFYGKAFKKDQKGELIKQ